jgi:hypothetical protein
MADIKNLAAVELGRLGGKASAAALTEEQRIQRARNAALARGKKLSRQRLKEIARGAAMARVEKNRREKESKDEEQIA